MGVRDYGVNCEDRCHRHFHFTQFSVKLRVFLYIRENVFIRSARTAVSELTEDDDTRWNEITDWSVFILITRVYICVRRTTLRKSLRSRNIPVSFASSRAHTSMPKFDFGFYTQTLPAITQFPKNIIYKRCVNRIWVIYIFTTASYSLILWTFWIH